MTRAIQAVQPELAPSDPQGGPLGVQGAMIDIGWISRAVTGDNAMMPWRLYRYILGELLNRFSSRP